MGRYDNKTVVITGGTTGIGLATAKFLLEEGAQVRVAERRLSTRRAQSSGRAPSSCRATRHRWLTSTSWPCV